jgi:hypothetical protein
MADDDGRHPTSRPRPRRPSRGLRLCGQIDELETHRAGVLDELGPPSRRARRHKGAGGPVGWPFEASLLGPTGSPRDGGARVTC